MSLPKNNKPFVRGGSDDVCHGIAPQFSAKSMGMFADKKVKDAKEQASEIAMELAASKATF